jgi:hypothetical protein
MKHRLATVCASAVVTFWLLSGDMLAAVMVTLSTDTCYQTTSRFPQVQKVFSLKPIQHRDEHYAYFVAQLMKRIKTAPRPITPPVSTSPLLTMMRAPSMRAPAAVPLRADGLPALPSSDGSLTGK